VLNGFTAFQKRSSPQVSALANYCDTHRNAATAPPNGLTTRSHIDTKPTHTATRRNAAALDYGQPRTNTYHHPEKLLRDDEDDGP
jgi:hypothetical protein